MTDRLREIQEREDEQHQREIWESRCPALLAECDRLRSELASARAREEQLDAALSQIENITSPDVAAHEIARDALAAVSAARDPEPDCACDRHPYCACGRAAARDPEGQKA